MSDMDKLAPVIRIVRKKGGHGGHHGGAWKVAYADFVTAMMAFFLVMWIVGLSKETKDMIQAYFRDPNGFMKTTRGGRNPMNGGDAIAQGKGKASPFMITEGGKDGVQDSLEAQQRFKSVEEAILKQMAKTPEFKGLRDSVEVHMTNEGLLIELEEKTSSLFFDSGSASLKPRTVRLLQLIAHELRKLHNPIVIEGHTDRTPLNRSDGYSNWELSADRANSARRAMEHNGLLSGQVLAVRGYADRKLLRPNDPYHFSNRRVSILVAYQNKGL